MFVCGVVFVALRLQLVIFRFLFSTVCTVLGLEEGKECVIVGTLYKHMKLKPCILDEYSKEVNSRFYFITISNYIA